MGKAAKRTARERLAEQRKRDAASRRRNRTLTITGIAIVVIIAVVGGGIAIAHSRDDSNPTAATRYTGPFAPATVDAAASAVTMAKPGVAKPRVDVYEDFQCPWCQRFEESTGNSVIARMAGQGKLKVVYHLMAFVNPIGSPRAAAAALCVPADRWMAYHDALFAGQPAESTNPQQSAYTVDRLAGMATKAGLDAKTVGCVKRQSHITTVKANNDKFGRVDHVNGTPTVRVNGGADLPFPATVLDRAKLTKAITG
jgi:protein-disulfide isomerase